MTARPTVVFADLTGSTSVFETLGNAEATRAVTALTQWIGRICQDHHGRVVKTLGDGVLAVFGSGADAIEAVVQLLRDHARRRQGDGVAGQLELQVGLDSGEIVVVDGDCYGDAVNTASRLSDLSGARQIWATDSVIDQLALPPPGVRFHALGSVTLRGKAQQRRVYRVEWQEDSATDMMTVAGFEPLRTGGHALPQGAIALQYLDVTRSFHADELPVVLGRSRDAGFVVADQRVSRQHASIDWRNGSFVLEDTSSFGTCVRFSGAATELPLRRSECVLHDSGEIALAGNFEDFTAPVVLFTLTLPRR